MKILITGSVASGKTCIAKELAKEMNLSYIDVKELIKNNPLAIDGKEDGELIINENLKKILQKELPKNCVYETHLIEYCPKADIYVILRAKPSILKKRMQKRGYSNKKIKENIEVEILDYFTQIIKSKNCIEFDSSKSSAKNNAQKIKELIMQKKFNKGKFMHDEKELKKALERV